MPEEVNPPQSSDQPLRRVPLCAEGEGVMFHLHCGLLMPVRASRLWTDGRMLSLIALCQKTSRDDTGTMGNGEVEGEALVRSGQGAWTSVSTQQCWQII